VCLFHRLFHYMPERRTHRARWVGALQQASIPLRLINGPLDPVSGEHLQVRYRELIEDADVVSLAGIGHYPQLEDPEGVWRAARPILTAEG
jgi:pimeloyl-ACP methyl ester carboxylesterase